MTKQALWKDTVLAESEDIVEVEGNDYFPRATLNMDHFSPSSHTTVCPWKGTAAYMHVEVNGETLRDAAWYYPDPKEAAAHIENRVAFWKGVVITETE